MCHDERLYKNRLGIIKAIAEYFQRIYLKSNIFTLEDPLSDEISMNNVNKLYIRDIDLFGSKKIFKRNLPQATR